MVTPVSIELVSYRSGCPLSVVFDGRQPDGWSVYSAQQCERRLVPLDQSTVPVWRYKNASVLDSRALQGRFQIIKGLSSSVNSH